MNPGKETSNTSDVPRLSCIKANIEILQGRNLVAKDRNLLGVKTTSDPYVRVYFCSAGNKKGSFLGQTKTIPRTLNPDWKNSSGEGYGKTRFSINFGVHQANSISKRTSKDYFLLLIFDRDLLSDDDNMGTVVIPVADFTGNVEEATKWHPVQRGQDQFYCRNATGDLLVKTHLTEARRMRSVERGQEMTFSTSQFSQVCFGLSWDMIQNFQAVDLDTSVVALGYDGKFLMHETVYYGNLENSTHSIQHSGDEREGDEEGYDECIHLHLDKMPGYIFALYFILTVATPNKTFSDVKTATMTLEGRGHAGKNSFQRGICEGNLEQLCQDNNYTAFFLARLARRDYSGREWKWTPIQEGDTKARDFGSLIPEIKSYTRDLIPNILVDPKERIAIMRKGSAARLSDFCSGGVIPQWITFGLAWDMASWRAIDLDASAIMLDKDLQKVDLVFFKKLQSTDGSVIHCGDEREGDEVGDDEKILISLQQVSPDVHYIGFVINSYTGEELDDVDRASCHLFESPPHSPVLKDIATYQLSNSAHLDKKTALVMGCLCRGQEGNGDWYLRIISEAAHGRTAKANIDELQRYLRNNPPQPPMEHPEEEIVVAAMPDHIAPVNEEEEIVLLPW